MPVLEFRSYIPPSSDLVVDRRREGQNGSGAVSCSLSLELSLSLHTPNIRASAVLSCCRGVERTAKQPDFICLHISTELTAACVLGLYGEFTGLFLGGGPIASYVKRGCCFHFEDTFGIF